jgi:hypothetical protein
MISQKQAYKSITGLNICLIFVKMTKINSYKGRVTSYKRPPAQLSVCSFYNGIYISLLSDTAFHFQLSPFNSQLLTKRVLPTPDSQRFFGSTADEAVKNRFFEGQKMTFCQI